MPGSSSKDVYTLKKKYFAIIRTMRLRYLASNTAGVRPSTSASRKLLQHLDFPPLQYRLRRGCSMIHTYNTHFRIAGHGFLLKILLHDMKSASVKLLSPKLRHYQGISQQRQQTRSSPLTIFVAKWLNFQRL